MAVVDDGSDVAVVRKAPRIPLEAPTRESLTAEAAAMGDAFTEVTTHPADLVADAEEMLQAREDAKDLAKRGYHVSDGQFKRVELLVELIKPLIAQQSRQIEASKLKTEAADAARLRLISIRAALARIGVAAGVPAPLFSLETNNTQRLNVVMMKMEEVLENVRVYREQLPDKKRVDALVTEARTLIDHQKDARTDARLLRSDRSIDSRVQSRYERMLLDALQHLSTQGMAAYPEDPNRDRLYRLDQIYGRRASKVGDPGGGPPGGENPPEGPQAPAGA